MTTGVPMLSSSSISDIEESSLGFSTSIAGRLRFLSVLIKLTLHVRLAIISQHFQRVFGIAYHVRPPPGVGSVSIDPHEARGQI